MDYNSGSTFGYDQVHADVHLDGYDAPYTNAYGGVPHRTMQTPKNVTFREPIASYYETMRHPWHSPDSSLLEQKSSMPENLVVPSACACSKSSVGCSGGKCASGCSSSGIPGVVGKMLDCGCGCRGAKKISGMKSVKDKLVDGNLDINSISMMFILVLALIVIVNGMKVKNLTKQVKMLTKALTRNVFAGPGPPANA